MNDQSSRFGWIDTMLIFSLWVVVLKTFRVLVYVSSLEAMMPCLFPPTILNEKVAYPLGNEFFKWLAVASSDNPFLAYLERLVLTVSCFAFLCLFFAVLRLFVKRRNRDGGSIQEVRENNVPRI